MLSRIFEILSHSFLRHNIYVDYFTKSTTYCHHSETRYDIYICRYSMSLSGIHSGRPIHWSLFCNMYIYLLVNFFFVTQTFVKCSPPGSIPCLVFILIVCSNIVYPHGGFSVSTICTSQWTSTSQSLFFKVSYISTHARL